LRLPLGRPMQKRDVARAWALGPLGARPGPRLWILGVSLVVCSDLSPAAWIVTSTEPWHRLVTIGPAGFAAYARVRFIPDPTYQGQPEHEADLDASPGETDQWRAMLHLLAADTIHPDDCYFGSWRAGIPGVGSRLAHLRCSPRRSDSGPLLLPVSRVALGSRVLRSARAGRDLGSARVLAWRHARVRLAIGPHVVRRGGYRPTLGRDRGVRADDRAPDR
jgi:hypothetical protein